MDREFKPRFVFLAACCSNTIRWMMWDHHKHRVIPECILSMPICSVEWIPPHVLCIQYCFCGMHWCPSPSTSIKGKSEFEIWKEKNWALRFWRATFFPFSSLFFFFPSSTTIRQCMSTEADGYRHTAWWLCMGQMPGLALRHSDFVSRLVLPIQGWYTSIFFPILWRW